jgi:homogentisate 1,2-dioxygenase
MESFVHLRKGNTPRRLHADLDGLKDDELGRGGFTGRTANFFRRHDPTAYRAVGPLSPRDLLASELTPGDASDPAGAPLLRNPGNPGKPNILAKPSKLREPPPLA